MRSSHKINADSSLFFQMTGHILGRNHDAVLRVFLNLTKS
jgi:hypothetical protein